MIILTYDNIFHLLFHLLIKTGISVYLTINTLPFDLQIGMINDVTDEHCNTRNHGIEDDELCQMTVDNTSVDTVEVELKVRQLEDIHIRAIAFQERAPLLN